MNKKPTITFVGAGAIAEAIISGLVGKGVMDPSQIIVTNRSNEKRLRALCQTYQVRSEEHPSTGVRGADIIVLAFKPSDVTDAIHSIKDQTDPSQVFVSVVAGVPTDTITRLLGHAAPIIRTMPNTGAAVGASATALSLGVHATGRHLEIACSLLKTIGRVTIVEEKDLDAVTGLSGSGPAYIYYLVEAMETAAEHIGLNPVVAKELILQTIIGAALTLRASPEDPACHYRRVMSPGGTTEAGFAVLEDYRFQEAVAACIERATERSREMGAVFEHVR